MSNLAFASYSPHQVKYLLHMPSSKTYVVPPISASTVDSSEGDGTCSVGVLSGGGATAEGGGEGTGMFMRGCMPGRVVKKV